MKRFLSLSLAMLMAISISACGKTKDEDKLRIATSFYPMYVATLNITDGAKDTEIMNLIDSDYGCVHNYMISPEDIKKLDGTRLFIACGLEMENFIAKNSLGIPKLEVLESGEDIPNIIADDRDQDNPHYWMNIENAMSHCDKICRTLEKIDPDNAEIYKKNTEEYKAKLSVLLEEATVRMDKLGKKEMVALDDSFEYFADEFDIEFTNLLARHGRKASEEQIAEAVEYIKSNNVKTVYVAKGDEGSDAVRAVERETGCKVVTLDTVTRGSKNKDAYFDATRANLDVLEANMG